MPSSVMARSSQISGSSSTMRTTGRVISAFHRPALRIGEDDAHVYAEGLRRGGTLVTARVPEAERARVEAILERNAVNIRDRGTAYRKSGWKGYDPSAPTYTADQVRRERELYRRSAA